MVALLCALLTTQSLEEVERSRFAAMEQARRAGPGTPALLEAEWEYGHALRRLAEFRKTPELWKRLIAFWTDIIWTYDDTLIALEARLVLGQAHQALADWGPCFAHLKAVRLTDTPERRKNPELADLATRALILEARARMAQGRDHEISLRAARAHLAQFPSDADLFLRLRVETARLLHAAHADTESRRVLEELAAKHARTDAGDEALVLLAELFGRRIDEAAERLFETHDVLRAAVLFRRLPRTPHTGFRLGQCYRRAGRPHEAVDVLRPACAAASPDRLDAALELEKALLQAGAPVAEHRAWMLRTFGEKLGPRHLWIEADRLLREQKFAEAADLYGRIEGDVEAIHSRAWCHYRLQQYEKSLELFRAYLASERRTPKSADTAIDVAAWCLARLNRAADLLEHVERHAPADPVKAQWRQAHRVDALARLGRFEEARAELGRMKEDVALDPTLRALEQLAAGYEAVVRQKNDPKLWASYARTVLALSEKSLKPLKGEKLLSAADAIHLEATPDAYALSFELYSQYLAAAKLRAEDERPIQYRRAVAAAGSGRLERALEIADALTVAEPFNGTFLELRADVLGLQGDALPRSPERRKRLEAAAMAYGELSAARRTTQDEAWFRLTWKYAARLAEVDPDRTRRYLQNMERRGYGDWDEGRWGYREKMAEVRRKLVP